jgi:hypothetical protein
MDSDDGFLDFVHRPEILNTRGLLLGLLPRTKTDPVSGTCVFSI